MEFSRPRMIVRGSHFELVMDFFENLLGLPIDFF